MGLGNYSFSMLGAIRGIAFRALEKYPTAQVVETGLKVSCLLEAYRKDYPDKIPLKPGGLLGGSYSINDFELALHLIDAKVPAMVKLIKSAKGPPALLAYLCVLTSGKELPPEHLLESALPFALESLAVESEIAKRWGQDLQSEVERLAPLASTGLLFKGGRKQGAIGPLRAAVRRRLKDYSKETPAEIWAALSGKAPKGMVFCDNRAGKYVEYDKRTYSGNLKNTGYGQFANIVSSEKKRLKTLRV